MELDIPSDLFTGELNAELDVSVIGKVFFGTDFPETDFFGTDFPGTVLHGIVFFVDVAMAEMNQIVNSEEK